jgi:hypothetical protein
MTPNTLRQLWALIESTQVSTLLQVDDSALVQLLLNQLQAKQSIDAQTASNLDSYITSKLPLIRDTAEGRSIQSRGYSHHSSL